MAGLPPGPPPKCDVASSTMIEVVSSPTGQFETVGSQDVTVNVVVTVTLDGRSGHELMLKSGDAVAAECATVKEMF